MKLPSPNQVLQKFRQAGFSLVETLMATGIISTAALSTLGLLASSMTSSQDGNLRSKGLVIAQEIFHDLQLGAMNVKPAVKDERQTNGLRPEMGLAFTRYVLFYDRAGIPLTGNQPANGTHQQIYQDGTVLPGVEWLVSIEGAPNADFTSMAGNGQVTALPAAGAVTPLGTTAYPFATVSSPPDPTQAPPATGLTQVRISIETPPSAPAKSRKKFSYEFFWNR